MRLTGRVHVSTVPRYFCHLAGFARRFGMSTLVPAGDCPAFIANARALSAILEGSHQSVVLASSDFVRQVGRVAGSDDRVAQNPSPVRIWAASSVPAAASLLTAFERKFAAALAGQDRPSRTSALQASHVCVAKSPQTGAGV